MHVADVDAPAPSRRRAAGQDPAKRAQILEGAKRCFLQMGFEAASMNEITAESGVSKGTLYVYFKDKSDLFSALVDAEKSAIMGQAQRELERPGTIAERLHRFGTTLIASLNSDYVIRAQRMVLAVTDRMPELAQRFYGSQTLAGNVILRDWLVARVAEGHLRIADPALAAQQFLELCGASIYKQRLFGNIDVPTAEHIDRVVAAAVDIFLGYYAVGDR